MIGCSLLLAPAVAWFGAAVAVNIATPRSFTIFGVAGK